jgi:hypothetical protein
VEVPDVLRSKFVGAIAEWANDSEAATSLILYTNREEFGYDVARVDIAFDKV